MSFPTLDCTVEFSPFCLCCCFLITVYFNDKKDLATDNIDVSDIFTIN